MQAFQQGPIFGNITFLDKEKCIIKANINDNVKNGKIRYFAASPMDKITGFSGAGLPFPNPEIAFESTLNQGEIEVERENAFEISLLKPNSYYVHMGRSLCHHRSISDITTESPSTRSSPSRWPILYRSDR